MIRALISKEWLELMGNLGPLGGLIAVLVVVFSLTAQLFANTGTMRVGVVDRTSECKNLSQLQTLLTENPEVVHVRLPALERARAWSVMDGSRLQILFRCELTGDQYLWRVFAKFRNSDERVRAEHVLEQVRQGLTIEEPREASIDGESQRPIARSTPPAFEIQVRGGSLRPGSTWLMPGMALLLSLLLTFYLSSLSIVRERTRNTWSHFRLGRGVSLAGMMIGKATVPVLAGASLWCFFTVLGTAFGIGVKDSQVLLALLVCLPAIVMVAAQGILASALVKTELGALLTSAAYLVGMTLLSGIIVPSEWSGELIRITALPFPLTHALPAVHSATLFGATVLDHMNELKALWILGIVSVLFAAAALSWRLVRH